MLIIWFTYKNVNLSINLKLSSLIKIAETIINYTLIIQIWIKENSSLLLLKRTIFHVKVCNSKWVLTKLYYFTVFRQIIVRVDACLIQFWRKKFKVFYKFLSGLLEIVINLL